MRNVLIGVLTSALVVATAVKMQGQQGGRGGKSQGAEPWPVFSKMTDHEKRAICEYLRAIPCLPAGSGRCT